MNTRGPIPDPLSRRSLARSGGVVELPGAPEKLVPPDWVRERPGVLPIFEEMASKAADAGVPIKQVDSEWLGVAAQATADYRLAESAKDRGRIARFMVTVYATLGLHPVARLRMGLRGKKAPKQTTAGRLIAMVEAKESR